jgi:outer membrane protein OmpA-like peptidoglycan-associated protein
MSARLHISGEGLVLSIFRMGELMSYNDAEKAIYRLAASDESRHVAFGVMHLQYLAQTDPERKQEIHSYLDEIEIGLIQGFGGQNPAARGTPSSAALSILLGGGSDVASLREGEQIALAVRQRQIKEYIQRVRVAGFGDRFEDGRANPALAQYIAA